MIEPCMRKRRMIEPRVIELCFPAPPKPRMKKIGIVGGVSWLSTVEYYSQICRQCEQHHLASGLAGPPPIPEMTIESLDLSQTVAFLGANDDEASWSEFDEYHRAALLRLEANGVDFALIASNTPHHRFEAIVRGVEIPVLNMLHAVAIECARIGALRLLVLGTALTMSSSVFRREFARYGIAASGPEKQNVRSAVTELIDDLQRGQFQHAAERLSAIVRASLTPGAACPAVCLACTELPLAFPEQKILPSFELDGITYINTTIVHANAAFDFALE